MGETKGFLRIGKDSKGYRVSTTPPEYRGFLITHAPPPIPCRHFDWRAERSDDEPPIFAGSLAELKERIDEECDS